MYGAFIYHFIEEKKSAQRHADVVRQFEEEYQYWGPLIDEFTRRLKSKSEKKVDWKNEGF